MKEVWKGAKMEQGRRESSNKKSDLNSTISMIVLNVNGLKGQRLLY